MVIPYNRVRPLWTAILMKTTPVNLSLAPPLPLLVRWSMHLFVLPSLKVIGKRISPQAPQTGTGMTFGCCPQCWTYTVYPASKVHFAPIQISIHQFDLKQIEFYGQCHNFNHHSIKRIRYQSSIEYFTNSCNLQATDKSILALLLMALVLALLPTRLLILAMFLEVFTNHSPLRRASTERCTRRLREWWFSIPAAPVVVEKDNKEDKKTKWIRVYKLWFCV